LHFGQSIAPVVSFRLLCQPLDTYVDLGHREAGYLETEVEPQLRELLQLLGEQAVVSHRVLGQAVVGDHEGPGLVLAQMVDGNHRSFGPSEQLGGQWVTNMAR
jgi:hypothetical protein